MSATTSPTTTGERVNWEVVWGPDEQDRVLYVDYGDGSFVSQDAETRATRRFLQMVTDGARCGIYRNGALVSARSWNDTEEQGR